MKCEFFSGLSKFKDENNFYQNLHKLISRSFSKFVCVFHIARCSDDKRFEKYIATELVKILLLPKQ